MGCFAETRFDFEGDALYVDLGQGTAWGLGLALSDWVDSHNGRVENLALYERLNLSEGRLTSDFQNHEDWLCEVLRAFCGVKNLTIVAGREHNPDESCDLMFATPMSVSRLTRRLSSLVCHLGLLSVQLQ